MKMKMACLMMVMMLSAGFGNVNLAHAVEPDAAGVAAAADGFYAALNAMFAGDAEPMQAVWSHADDVTYMGPAGGFQEGWAVVDEVWVKHAAMKLGGKVTPETVKMTVGRDIAITHNYEIGENYDAEGTLQQVSIRATNIFRKEDGQWKMIGHHTDLLPYLEKQSAQ